MNASDAPMPTARFTREGPLLEQVISRLAHLVESGTDEAHFNPPPSDWHDQLLQALAASAALTIERGTDVARWREAHERRGHDPADLNAALDRATADPDTCLGSIPSLLSGRAGVSRPANHWSTDDRTDIPSKPSSYSFPVWAGVGSVESSATVGASTGGVLSTVVDVKVLVPAGRRGAHMSRLQQAIHESESAVHDTPLTLAHHLAESAFRDQDCDAAKAAVTVRLKVPTSTARSGRASSIQVQATATATHPSHDDDRVTLAVGIMTACPCTLMYSNLLAAEVVGDEKADDLPPTFTHSQPGLLTLSVTGPTSNLPSPMEMLHLAASAAHLREAILKRPDEHDLVERAHRNPQFTEDVARAAASMLASAVDGDCFLTVTASLAESIHPHTAEASVSGTASTLWSSHR